MGLSALAFRAFLKGCTMPLEKEMHGMPVPGIKKAPGFRGLFGKSRSMSCNILIHDQNFNRRLRYSS